MSSDSASFFSVVRGDSILGGFMSGEGAAEGGLTTGSAVTGELSSANKVNWLNYRHVPVAHCCQI